MSGNEIRSKKDPKIAQKISQPLVLKILVLVPDEEHVRVDAKFFFFRKTAFSLFSFLFSFPFLFPSFKMFFFSRNRNETKIN